jgi:hypothetical protein
MKRVAKLLKNKHLKISDSVMRGYSVSSVYDIGPCECHILHMDEDHFACWAACELSEVPHIQVTQARTLMKAVWFLIAH